MSATSRSSASAATAKRYRARSCEMTVVMVEDLDPSSADAGVPAHYGDPMREQRVLDTAVGLVDRSNRDVVAVPGEERASWLHTLTTQHLSGLSAGQATELLVLSP